MRRANAAVPGAAPALLGQDPAPARWRCSSCRRRIIRCGRTQLRDGHADPGFAAAVARPAGAHPCRDRRRSRASPPNSRPMRSSTTSGWSPTCWRPPARIPTWRRGLKALVATTQANKRALVHGDVSPKNILGGPAGPVFLDAECAWWGDPAFDLAFCLNHLLLKCLWTPRARDGFLACFEAMADDLLRRRRLGAGGGAGSASGRACCPGCSWRGWMASRRSNTSPRSGQGPGAPRRPRAAGRAAGPARRDPPGLDQGARDMTDRNVAIEPTPTSPSCTAAASGTAAAAPPWRPTCCWKAARSAAPSRPPAPPPVSGEALDLRDGGAAFGGYDVTRAVAQRERRDRRRGHRHGRDRPGGAGRTR